MEKYINLRFDTKHAPYFFYGQYMGARKLIGENRGAYVVQFRSVKQAENACRAYRKYVESLGFCRKDVCYLDCVHADLGNHSAWHVWKLDQLKQNLFYLGQ